MFDVLRNRPLSALRLVSPSGGLTPFVVVGRRCGHKVLYRKGSEEFGSFLASDFCCPGCAVVDV